MNKYLMTLDSVKTDDPNNLMIAEYSLVKYALMGNPIILTPNQAMDSIVLQDIIIGNEKEGKNQFCEAITKGIIQVAVSDSFSDLLDYCKRSLNRTDSEEFVISGLRFLNERNEGDNGYVHPLEERKEVAAYICRRLERYKKKNLTDLKPEWLSNDEKEQLEKYIDSILMLNEAVKGYEEYVSKKQLFPKYLEEMLSNRLSEIGEDDKQRREFITLVLNNLRESGSQNRSHYYRLIDANRKHFDDEVFNEIKQLIDMAYNGMNATSVGAEPEYDVASNHSNLVTTVIEKDRAKAYTTSYDPLNEGEEHLDWESVIRIYDEVTNITDQKGCAWEEALRIYHSRQHNAAFKISAKYGLFCGAKFLLSALLPGSGVIGAIFNIASEPLGNELSAAVGHFIDMPDSIGDIVNASKKARKDTRILDTLIQVDSDRQRGIQHA